jgi:hypothetical protein
VGDLAGDVVRDRAPRLIIEVARTAFSSVLRDTELRTGEPVPVRAPTGEPGYWLVPGLRKARVAAIARVFPVGRLATVGELRVPAADAAEAVTGLSAVKAKKRADLQTILVHDGPVGREAWMTVEPKPDGTTRWVFATGGGTYERYPDN